MDDSDKNCFKRIKHLHRKENIQLTNEKRQKKNNKTKINYISELYI